ncbi:hypothetical protein [Maricaulis sp.]|uniref:hypothetical protein n=1 Tax=Maricaulis sp. TaxID=1486257 RepID=UPI003A92FB27
MGFRLAMTVAAALLTTTGLTAAAYSLTQGQTDQAIAFGWPAIAIAIAFAIVIPSQSRAQSQIQDLLDSGLKNGS